MILEPRRLTYRRSSAHQAEWHESVRAYGVCSDADPVRSLDSEIEAWGLGQVAFLIGDLRGQTITPMSPDASRWSSDYLSLKLVTSGETLIEEKGATHKLGPGGIVLVDRQRPYKIIFPQRATGVSMRVPRRALLECGFRAALNRAYLPDVSSPDVQSVRALIECIAGQPHAPSAAVARRLGDQLLDLMDIVLDVPETTGRRRTAATIVHMAKQFIERHAGDPDLTPALVAAHACISRKHLERLFRAQGTSLMRYVLSIRLEQAARLLAAMPWHRNLVQQIAYQCGFSSASHFSHAFKQRYGVAPADVHASARFPATTVPPVSAEV